MVIDLEKDKDFINNIDWDIFRGNNHHRIVNHFHQYGGGGSFRKHLDKPLSNALWQDLFERFLISGLCIYAYDEDQWLLGWGPKHCIIRLDKDNNVFDIEICPECITFPPPIAYWDFANAVNEYFESKLEEEELINKTKIICEWMNRPLTIKEAFGYGIINENFLNNLNL
jgi:hypothetical protein